jgi:hypothetical protein
VREVCADDGYSWTKLEVCESSAICNGDGCFPCEAGDLRCAGDGSGDNESTELQRCTDDEEWEVLENCETAELCHVAIAKADDFMGACAPPACPSAGELECFDNVLKRCSPSLTKWTEVDTCETVELCEATAALATDPESAASITECEAP